MHGARGTIESRGCFEVYSAVGKSFTRPILAFTEERFEALETHLNRPRDLLAQLAGDGVELLLAVAAALRPGGPGVAPVAEALAAGALEALGPRDEGQRAPDPGALAVGAAVGAVGHVLEGEAFHVGPRLEQPALRVLQAPEPGLEVVDELQRPEHQAVALLQAPRPPGQGLSRPGTPRRPGSAPAGRV